jgi:hypothetical protein
MYRVRPSVYARGGIHITTIVRSMQTGTPQISQCGNQYGFSATEMTPGQIAHCFGGSLAQTVVDLSRSEFQNTSFCASAGVVPIVLAHHDNARMHDHDGGADA